MERGIGHQFLATRIGGLPHNLVRAISMNLYSEVRGTMKLQGYAKPRKAEKGQELIEFYYEWSPLILRSILEDGALKKDLQEMVDGVLPLVREVAK